MLRDYHMIQNSFLFNVTTKLMDLVPRDCKFTAFIVVESI